MIVGYQGVATENAGYKSFVGATFSKVDGSKVTLGDIGINENFGVNGDTITLLNEYGGAIASYVYFDKEMVDGLNDGTGFEFQVGWYNYSEVENWDGESTLATYNSTQLYAGESVMVQAATEGAGLVFSGLVDDLDINVVCENPGAKTFLSNCTPVDLTLGDILPNDKFGINGDTITFLNQYGGATGSYVYFDQEMVDGLNDGTGFKFVVGWYNYAEIENWDGESTLSAYNDISLPAGKGFLVQAAVAGAGIVVPSAL